MMNSQRIRTPSGRDRIPDFFDEMNRLMGEAKSVKYLTKTRQLVDMFEYANANGFEMFLTIESWTRMSKPLQQAIDMYKVAVRFF